jgi:two-component system chemotaxis response regulator CheB
MNGERKIKVLVVDDSAIVRKLLTDAISSEPDLEVVGTAPDPYIARDKILTLQPDVLTLDVEMPRMDGLTFLKKVMHYRPLPVIIISSLGQASCQVALDALRLGAVEVLAKPGGPYSVGELRTSLASKIRAAAAARLRVPKPPEPGAAVTLAPQAPAPPPRPISTAFDINAVIAIGASTGGTEALKEVLMHMPANSPGIVITQHIPPVFSRAFAARLNELCPMEVKEAADGDVVAPGRALVAPGNFHMLLRKVAEGYRVQIKDGPQVCYQRPSVDVLFSSVADVAGAATVAAILTGMGADGAQGMLKLKRAGARTIAQDEASCVVFGMPREAIKAGAVDKVVPLTHVAGTILKELHVPVGIRG